MSVGELKRAAVLDQEVTIHGRVADEVWPCACVPLSADGESMLVHYGVRALGGGRAKAPGAVENASPGVMVVVKGELSSEDGRFWAREIRRAWR